MPSSVDDLQQAMASERYVAGRGLAVSTFLALTLKRPLFLEGEPGVGKTEVAKVLASALDTELIRLQCYEGLDVSHAVYEWNYPRQILEIRLLEGTHALDRKAAERELFTEPFLIKRPLLRAIEQSRDRPPVLLIERIDRADGEFEDICSSCSPATRSRSPSSARSARPSPPIVVITSGRTREVHDALKRRCVYCWIDYPDADTEHRIVCAKVPGVSEALASQITAFVQELRGAEAVPRPPACRNARLGRGAGRAEPRAARCGDGRRDAGDAAEEPGRHPGRAQSACRTMLARAAPGAGRRDSTSDRRQRACCSVACCVTPGSTCTTGVLSTRFARCRSWVFATAPTSAPRFAACSCTGDDLARFDEAFDLFFRAHRPPCGSGALLARRAPRVVAARRPARPSRPRSRIAAGSTDATPRSVAAWSASGVSRTKDFAELTPAELERARALLEDLPWQLSLRRTRRWERSTGGAVDLRPIVRRNLMRGGDLLELPRRRRRETARPIVLLGDVSGSMERYSRVLLHFVYGLARSGARVGLPVRDAAHAGDAAPYRHARRRTFGRLVRDVQDWGGGTRIGEALRAFSRH